VELDLPHARLSNELGVFPLTKIVQLKGTVRFFLFNSAWAFLWVRNKSTVSAPSVTVRALPVFVGPNVG